MARLDLSTSSLELRRTLVYGTARRADSCRSIGVLMIQAANTLCDERTEFLINDRVSFMRFFGSSLSDRVPDAGTIWLVRETLITADRDAAKGGYKTSLIAVE